MILIHGTWANADVWEYMEDDLAALNLEVITPNLRYHDLPYEEAMKKIGDISISDYVDDIVEIVASQKELPLLLGHSLGCLIAQLVAERVKVKGMILLGPAPTADIFQLYPTMVQAFAPHFMQWGFWYKPMPPSRYAQFDLAMQNQSPLLKEKIYSEAMPESGLVYTQMAFPELDPEESTRVDFTKVTCPILIITGSEDKMTVPGIAKETAKNYGNQARLIKISGADHYYIAGKFKNQVIFHINRWLGHNDMI